VRTSIQFLGEQPAEVQNFQEELKKWLISVAFERGFQIRRLVYHFLNNEASRRLNFDFLSRMAFCIVLALMIRQKQNLIG
jgi:hypothetical protein